MRDDSENRDKCVRFRRNTVDFHQLCLLPINTSVICHGVLLCFQDRLYGLQMALLLQYTLIDNMFTFFYEVIVVAN